MERNETYHVQNMPLPKASAENVNGKLPAPQGFDGDQHDPADPRYGNLWALHAVRYLKLRAAERGALTDKVSFSSHVMYPQSQQSIRGLFILN